METEPESIVLRKKLFFTIAQDYREYERDVGPTEELIAEIRKRKADIFTFIERRWTHTIANPDKSWLKAEDNIALLHVKSFDEWWKNIGKKTRNMVRKAEKSGIRTVVAKPDERLAEGIWKIYNETPIRQERGFPHYGTPLEDVKLGVLSRSNCTYIGAYLQDELVGFIRLVHGDDVTFIDQILSLQKHSDKAVNNALIAKAVEFCANKNIHWLMYGRMGNHPTLDTFKQNNGCIRFQLIRYYVVLTTRGRIAAKLGLHREIKDALPQPIKDPLFPIYNWISRVRMRTRLWLRG